MGKIDITSSAVEKGIDLAKSFLDKLIGPAVEETGLLLKDKVTIWKFNNQVKMLKKAKSICEDNNITPKAISLKLMCPLLDYAALEEDEILQDKWATLLANMVDSEQNIENHVFPYLLSQISINEFKLLESYFKEGTKSKNMLREELQKFRSKQGLNMAEIQDLFKEIDNELEVSPEDSKLNGKEDLEHDRELHRLIIEMKQMEEELEMAIDEPIAVPSILLEKYEIANLIRLGLINSKSRSYAYIDGGQIKNKPKEEFLDLRDLDIHIEHEDDDHTITELGELFIQACNRKAQF